MYSTGDNFLTEIRRAASASVRIMQLGRRHGKSPKQGAPNSGGTNTRPHSMARRPKGEGMPRLIGRVVHGGCHKLRPDLDEAMRVILSRTPKAKASD